MYRVLEVAGDGDERLVVAGGHLVSSIRKVPDCRLIAAD